MEFQLKTKELIELDKEIFIANKVYGMALTSLNNLPNIHAVKEFVSLVESLKSRLEKVDTDDEFEKLFIENSLLNLEAQRAYLEYFTTGDKEDIDKVIEIILGENALDTIKNKAKDFDYKGFWEYYLSYQEYTYRQIPSDDESLREAFKKILADLKVDVINYACEHFNFPKDYDFELVLGQPYSQRTYFQPTIRRMEISPSSFFVFKDNNEVKINASGIIASLFHEIIGHGRQEVNSRELPSSLQDNSINTSVPPLHIHSEGVAQKTRERAIDFMKLHKEKYNIEDDYIRQIELSEVSEDSISLQIFFQYLQLKQVEDSKIDIEKEFIDLTKNHGLYILYSTSPANSPLGCIKNSTYPMGLQHVNEILNKLKEKLGEKEYDKNHSLINQAISVGLWNFRVLPRFVKLFLNNNGLNV